MVGNEDVKESRDFSIEEEEGTRVRWWKCHYCKKKFNTLYQVQEHIKKSHKN